MKNEQRTTNNELRTNKAFTLIELVVAVALLAMMTSFAGLIFNFSIGAHRTAGANAEIMQKLRAITDQLNSDFKGIRTDAPLLIWFQQDSTDPSQRYDQIMFSADGDFQSTQLYAGTPVVGNVARIYYGQAYSRDSRNNTMQNPDILLEADRLLARRQHILTADPDLPNFPDVTDFVNKFVPGDNDSFEHDRISLAQWKAISNVPAYNNRVIQTCFDNTNRPEINSFIPITYHKLMCEGVGSFAVQWGYWDSASGTFYWFPSNNPDGIFSTADSHFLLMGTNQFGVYFNMPGSASSAGWYNQQQAETQVGVPFEAFPPGFYPKALKFTFTLYDSKGILQNGRTFTHIVYIGD